MSGFCLNCVCELPEDVPQQLAVECVVKVEGAPDVSHTFVCKEGYMCRLIYPSSTNPKAKKPCIVDEKVKVEMAFIKQNNTSKISKLRTYCQIWNGKKWVKDDNSFDRNDVKKTQLKAGKYQIYVTCLFDNDIRKKVGEVRAEKAEQKAKELAKAEEAPEVSRSGQTEEAMHVVPTDTDDANMSEQVLRSGDGATYAYENAEALGDLRKTGVNDMLEFDEDGSTTALPTKDVRTESMEGEDKVKTGTLDELLENEDGSDDAPRVRWAHECSSGEEESEDSIDDSSDEDVIEDARRVLPRLLTKSKDFSEAAAEREPKAAAELERKAEEAKREREAAAERERKAEEAKREREAAAEREREAAAERVRKAEEAERVRLAEEAERVRLAEEAERKRKAEEAERERKAEEANRKRKAEEAEQAEKAAKAKRDRQAAERRAQQLRALADAEKQLAASKAQSTAQGNTFAMPTTKPKPQGKTKDGNVVSRSETLAVSSRTKK